jgi:hypothetical protein
VTIRPIRTFRWGYPVFFLVVAGGLLWADYENAIYRGPSTASLIVFLAVLSVAFAAFFGSAYIRVDDSSIVFGPGLLGRRFNRLDVARIRAARRTITRRTVLLRSDGSTLWSTAGSIWGREGLQSLADYLGVPFEGWGAGVD